MIAPTPEELAAMAERAAAVRMPIYHDSRSWQDGMAWADRDTLLAEVRRLQAERDAAPPVGQTVEEFVRSMDDRSVLLNRKAVEIGNTLHMARIALVAARDAEVARAAAEKERDRLRWLIDDEISRAETATHEAAQMRAESARWRRDYILVAEELDRSRAPAPAEKEPR